MSSAMRSGSCSGTSSAEIVDADALRAAEDEPGHHQRRRAPAVRRRRGAPRARSHGEVVLVGVPGHLDERLVARRHLVGLEPGLDAVEADHGVRHGRDPSFLRHDARRRPPALLPPPRPAVVGTPRRRDRGRGARAAEHLRRRARRCRGSACSPRTPTTPAGSTRSRSFGSVAPTLDLSVHVVRCPDTADLTYESRLIKVGRRRDRGRDVVHRGRRLRPYAVAVSTFVIVSEPSPTASRSRPPRRAVLTALPLDVRIEDHAGITPVAPGVVDIEHRPSVGNGRGTLQGGMVALVAERRLRDAARGRRRSPTSSPASTCGTWRRCVSDRCARRHGFSATQRASRSCGSRCTTSAPATS